MFEADVEAVIPDYAKLRYIVRAPTWADLEVLRGRVRDCFECVLNSDRSVPRR